MTALEDTRPLAEITADLRADWRAIDLGDALRDLLNSQPDVELASIRITTRQATPADVEQVTVAGRVGLLVDGEPGCPSCHVHGQQPHTEYCQLVDHASQLTHAELYGPATGPNYRPRCSCPGLGINPDCRVHNHDPDEDEPVVDLVDHLRSAVDAARDQVNAAAARAHDHNRDVTDTKGARWHQTAPDEAHRREECDVTVCGWPALDEDPGYTGIENPR